MRSKRVKKFYSRLSFLLIFMFSLLPLNVRADSSTDAQKSTIRTWTIVGALGGLLAATSSKIKYLSCPSGYVVSVEDSSKCTSQNGMVDRPKDDKTKTRDLVYGIGGGALVGYIVGSWFASLRANKNKWSYQPYFHITNGVPRMGMEIRVPLK